MISPHTAPGTRVVCIDGEEHVRNIVPGYLAAREFPYAEIVEGQVYIVEKIVYEPRAKAGFAADLRGCSTLWSLERFKPAVLPECLTDILTKAPVDLERVP